MRFRFLLILAHFEGNTLDFRCLPRENTENRHFWNGAPGITRVMPSPHALPMPRRCRILIARCLKYNSIAFFELFASLSTATSILMFSKSAGYGGYMNCCRTTIYEAPSKRGAHYAGVHVQCWINRGVPIGVYV